MSKAKLYFTTGEPQDINYLEVPDFNVTGIATLGITSVTKLTAQEFNVSGVTTITAVGAKDILVSGITTLGITSSTNLTTQQLNVSGIASISSGPLIVGTSASTGTSSQPLQISGSAYVSGRTGIGTTNPTSTLHVVGNSLVTGISTVGLGTTSSPSNAQLTFELTSDTNLRIKVRGTDGILRLANITLA